MLFIPSDLFGAWIRGREYGIDRNWKDLNQANRVQQGWLQNDAQQLSNWFKQDSYDDQLARADAAARQAQNAAQNSDMNLQLVRAQQPGALATAALQSATQQALAAAGQGILPNYVTAQRNMWDANNAISNARAYALKEFGSPQLTNTARANNQNAINAAMQADYFNQTLPLQQQVRQADLNAQLRVLQNAGQPTTTPSADGGLDAGIYHALHQGLPPGSTTTVNGLDNVPITVGKTPTGQLYSVNNGKPVPLAPPAPTANIYGNLGTW